MRYSSLILPLILLCLSISISDAQVIRGFVIGTSGCSVRVHRQSPWGADEVSTMTDSRGCWEVDGRYFHTPLNQGNGFHLDYGLNLAYPMILSRHRGRDYVETVPDVHLDQFIVCIKDIAGSSNIAGDLKLYYQLMPRSEHNLKPVIVVTGQTPDASFDVHLALPKQRVSPNSILYLKLQDL